METVAVILRAGASYDSWIPELDGSLHMPEWRPPLARELFSKAIYWREIATHRFQKFLEANQLPRQRFHDLRHASASFLLAQGMPVKAIAERLGHSQISLTLSTYAHLGAELQGQAAEAMERVFTGSGRGTG